MFELESEIDIALTPVCFETIFRNKLIDNSFKIELLAFKQETDAIPQNLWDYSYIDTDQAWILVRKKANELLDKLEIKNKAYGLL
jgi:hypothetical protein